MVIRITAAMFLALATLGAQGLSPYASTKSWKGTLLIEATETTSGDISAPITTQSSYTASADLLLTDNMMPDGARAQWPFPDAAETADPKRAPNAFKKWNAHVTARRHATGKGELGEKVDYTCIGDETTLALVQLMIVPWDQNFQLRIEPPQVGMKCTGSNVMDQSGRLGGSELIVKGKRPDSMIPLSGSQTFTFGTATVKVTYKLTPA